MILRKRFRNFFYFFCNGLTNFTILAKHKNENEYKFRNILQLFLLFLLWTEKGIGIVLCKKVKTKQTIYNPDVNRDFFLTKMKEKIAIQGIKGSFHHQVALEYFQENVGIDECLSFEALADSLINNQSQLAVMAIENSIAGSIIPNYALIDKNNFHIIGEYYLDIIQNLMVLNGQKLEEIQEVHSHPMALLQCMDFLKKHPNIKLVEDKDTAETARRIHQNQIKGIAAIGSKVAAELYDLNIIAPEIQTVNNNMTRFFIISKEKSQVNKDEINKASIKFELDDTPGSLATVLNVMTNCKLNLTKIQSMPIIETPFQYSFFVDVVFEKYKHYEKAVKILEIMTNQFKVLGEYKKASPTPPKEGL